MKAGIYAGRFFRYFFSRIIIIAVAIVLVVLSFFVCMDYMNVNILIRDGFYKRAATVMHVNNDASILVKVFTKSFIDKDTLLSSHEYDDYIIRGFNHKLDVDFKLIFPWDNNIDVTITERITDIDGELPSEETDDSGAQSSKTVEPPAWQDARYKLTLSRDKENWKITSMTLLETLPKASKSASTSAQASETAAAQASASVAPSVSETPSASPNASASPSASATKSKSSKASPSKSK